MNDEEVLKLAESKPALVDSLTAALRNVVYFEKGRGSLLRSLVRRLDPRVTAIANLMRHPFK